MRIGVDLGGTNVRAGLVKDGHIVRLLSEPSKADRPEVDFFMVITSSFWGRRASRTRFSIFLPVR